MDEIYFLALSLVLGFSANAQISDDFESYPLEDYFGGHWSNWSGADNPSENIIISSDYASSGSQSAYVGNSGVQDAILNLGNKTSGVWTLQFNMFIEFGYTGYFNFQEDYPVAAGVWGLSFHFNDQVNYPDYPDQGLLYGADAENQGYLFDFPYDEWFTMKFVYDVEINYVTVTLNDTLIFEGAAGLDESTNAPQLGGMDFFSIHDNNSYYIDDLVFTDTMGVNDEVVSTVSVYPTKVSESFNVTAKSNIKEVSVFNTVGQ